MKFKTILLGTAMLPVPYPFTGNHGKNYAANSRRFGTGTPEDITYKGILCQAEGAIFVMLIYHVVPC